MLLQTSTEQAREALRREHGVRLVTPAEEGTAAPDFPCGVYGFTGSPVLASPLFAQRRYRNFEVHHLPNGVTCVVGFVAPAQAARLTGQTQAEPVTVTMYPDAEGDATAIVSIPYNRIVVHRQYAVRNAEAMTLQVVPS
jgi:hypothetical protein